MDARNTDSKLRLTGRIDRKTHDVSDLKSEYEDWGEMSKSEKLSASRDVEPVDTDTVYNVTTDLLHEYFVDNLDPGQTGSKANVTAAWLGLGTNAAGGTATSNTDLNTRVYEETVTDHADNGKELLTSTFLDSAEGNGNVFDELGLFSGDPNNLSNEDTFLINHATFADVTKDNSKTVTFDVTLTFSDV
jgi:hypothetical protein